MSLGYKFIIIATSWSWLPMSFLQLDLSVCKMPSHNLTGREISAENNTFLIGQGSKPRSWPKAAVLREVHEQSNSLDSLEQCTRSRGDSEECVRPALTTGSLSVNKLGQNLLYRHRTAIWMQAKFFPTLQMLFNSYWPLLSSVSCQDILWEAIWHGLKQCQEVY